MGVLSAWMAELAIITWRDFKKGATNQIVGFPLPADYLATFMIFGVLGALPDSARTFASVTGWGFVVATFLNVVDPTLNKAPTTTQTQAQQATTISQGVAPAQTPGVAIA